MISGRMSFEIAITRFYEKFFERFKMFFARMVLLMIFFLLILEHRDYKVLKFYMLARSIFKKYFDDHKYFHNFY